MIIDIYICKIRIHVLYLIRVGKIHKTLDDNKEKESATSVVPRQSLRSSNDRKHQLEYNVAYWVLDHGCLACKSNKRRIKPRKPEQENKENYVKMPMPGCLLHCQ